MKINKNIISDSKLINLIFAVVCLLILAFGIWAPKAFSSRSVSNQQKQPLSQREYDAMIKTLDPNNVPIRNMTRAVRIISIEKIEGGSLRLTLQNGYDKWINGIEISMVNVGIHEELGSTREHNIPPGGTYELNLGIQEHTDTDGIEIAAVIFEDGTADGNLEFVKPVQEQRLGARVQYKRALALIQKHLAEPDADTVEGLNRLESQLQSLPVDEESGKRGDYIYGLKQARNLLVVRMQFIREHRGQSAQSLLNLQNNPQSFSIRTELNILFDEFRKLVPEF
jgi:hypothetical protein